MSRRDFDVLRSPICAVLGHVDTGKTKILDKIRRTNVQDGEAGGITQQIGATFVPDTEILKTIGKVKKAQDFNLNVPGLLIIDTPGHEAFTNLRSRGSSICNIAILVVDIMHGMEPQTAESIELLRSRKAPFIIALNKIDRLNGWQRSPNAASQSTLKKQKPHTMQDFEDRWNRIKVQFAEKGLNTELWWENKNLREFVNVVPTSAHTGEGIPDLMYMLVMLSQRMLAKEIAFCEELECTVLEVKEVQGYGTTIDAILANGTLRQGDKIVVSGLDGAIVTTIRSLLMPQPLKELRVKNSYIQHKEVRAAQGVKIAARDLDKAVAGLPLMVARHEYEVPALVEDARSRLQATLNAIRTVDEGVVVQASTLGSLEALMTFLNSEKIPVSAVNIGPVHKKDVFRASIQLEREPKYALILAFDVPVDREAQAMADSEGIRIFTADIIYHLEEMFRAHMEEVKQRLREQHKHIAIFPCRVRILPDCIFNTRDPIVIGVHVDEGQIKQGTTLCIPSKGFLQIGVVASLEFDGQPVPVGRKGQDVCIKIEAVGGDKKMYGRHFDDKDILVSQISRKSIDACKAYFRDDLGKEDWKLMIKLKKLFQII
jgi:translation initiation factor 5B